MLPVEFDAALAMIDTARWRQPALKLRALLHVKTVTELDHVHGAEIGVRTAAAALCCSIRSAGVVLDALVADGVLVIVAPAAGSRGVTYAVEPRIARWRVPWSIDPELVATRLDLVAGRLVERRVDAKPAFARVTGRAQPWISRVTGRAQIGASARDGSRANDRPAYTPSRAQTGSADRAAPIPSNSDLSLEQSSDVAAGVGERVDALKRALMRRTGQSAYGAPLHQLLELCQRHEDVSELVRWIDRYPFDGHGVPLVVDALVLAAAELTSRPPAPPAPEPEPEEPKVAATPEERERVRAMLAGAMAGRSPFEPVACETVGAEGSS
jgi:hypothetical protein